MHYLAKLCPYVLFFSLSVVGHLVYAQGPYHGRVIDKETKQGIEGAAVVAIWRERAPGIAHPKITYHDAQETVTDQQGNFTIPGILGIPTEATAKIDEPSFIIFKPGYEAIGGRRLKPVPPEVQARLKVKDNVYEEKGIMVVEVRHLKTREERLKNLDRASSFTSCLPKELAERLKRTELSPGSPYCIPEEKFPNLIKLTNVERGSLGLKPTHVR